MDEAQTPLGRWWITRVLVAASAVVAVLVALRLVLEAFAQLAHVILLLLFGVVLAFLLAPLVEWLRLRVHREGVAVAVAALVALVVTIGALAILAVPLVRETRELARDIPRYAALLGSDEPIRVFGIEVAGDVRQWLVAEIGARAGDWSQEAARIAVRVAGGIIDVLFIFVLAVYLLASARALRVWILSAIPPQRRSEVERVEMEAVRLFGAYVRGQLLLGLIVGTISAVTYMLLGVPYAVFLGVLAGILELVPIAGPIIAGTVAALVALTQPWPLILWVAIAAIAIQQLENNLLVPRISGSAVGLHPLAALLAVLVGAEVAGIVGAVFAVPLTGLAWSVYRARRQAG